MPASSKTVRDRDRAVIRRSRPDCGICGEPIDYTLKYPHPDSYVVDHIVPTTAGGPDSLANKQAAHNHCNREKWDRTDHGPRRFVTSRTWRVGAPPPPARPGPLPV